MSSTYPLVDVATVLVTDPKGRFLVDYNEAWGRFTFPTTKLHELPATKPGGPVSKEPSLAAAVRAAAEVHGRPIDPRVLLPVPYDVAPYNQSGRDGQIKRYAFHLFTLPVQGEVRPLPGHAAVWLSRTELETLEPVSPTVRLILGVLPR